MKGQTQSLETTWQFSYTKRYATSRRVEFLIAIKKIKLKKRKSVKINFVTDV